MKKIISFLAFLLLTISFSLRADFNDGVVSYLMGDYDKAFKTMQSLAETSDHGYAQYYLGMMYMKGQGVTQDFEEAGKWFRKASEKSIPQAQYKLGDLYFKGRGVPKDYEFAYIWFSVGAAHNHKDSVNAVESAKEKLSSEQIAAADKQIPGYIEKYGPKKDIDPNEPIRIENN